MASTHISFPDSSRPEPFPQHENTRSIWIGEAALLDRDTESVVRKRMSQHPDTVNYDYIVVGAGSAGCAVASRLSENPRNRVLLLEAGGPDRNPWIHIPVGYFKTIYDSDLSWGYQTEPDSGIDGRSIVWPRGRVLGGSSSINGLLYVRGQAEDYDHWRQLGNTGWSFEDVLPFFRRSEDYEKGDDEFRSEGGPLGVQEISDRRPACEAYLAACREAGFRDNPDYNGATQEGLGYYQTTSRNGRRCSAAVAFLRPTRNRPNLRVITRAMAARIFVEDGRAAAIRYLQDGIEHEARADAEIVLSGGSINSPQLLQLSGIGSAEQLRDVGVEVVHDLPDVGRNLQDHYMVRSMYELDGLHSLNTDVRNPIRKMLMGIQYALTRRGPLTISAGQGFVFAKSRPELATPDIQLLLYPLSGDNPALALHDFPGVTVASTQLRPESRGDVFIKSADPAEHPRIRPNYLSADTDRQTMVAGMRLARDIAVRPAFARYVKREVAPGPDCTTDEDLLAHARAFGGTVYHPTGTCRMGPDDRAVVDPRLRVRGINGLRVADCSIMPAIVSGNTNAPAIMIGEKAAAMILEDSVR